MNSIALVWNAVGFRSTSTRTRLQTEGMFNDPEDYDAVAVGSMERIEHHLSGLQEAPWQPLRRSNMIRKALEGLVEYQTPPPQMVVFEQLKRALIAQTKEVGANVDWIRKELKLLEKHVRSRAK